MTIARELATWALELRPEDLPASTSKAVRRHLTDGIGNAAAARRVHEADFVLGTSTRFAPEPATSIIGGGTAGPEGSTFANGVLIHALDFDDTHADALVHITAITAPAALALADWNICLPV